MFTHDPMEPLVRAYQQTRVQEADQARLCRLARQGRATTDLHRHMTRVGLAARALPVGALAVLAALVTVVTVAALLVVSGQAPALG